MNVVRVYVGTLMTSLEMAGISLTLLQTPSQWVELLGKLEYNKNDYIKPE